MLQAALLRGSCRIWNTKPQLSIWSKYWGMRLVRVAAVQAAGWEGGGKLRQPQQGAEDVLHHERQGTRVPGRWPDTQRHSRSRWLRWDTWDHRVHRLSECKSPGIPFLGVPPRRHQLQLFCCSSAMTEFKDPEVSDSTLGNVVWLSESGIWRVFQGAHRGCPLLNGFCPICDWSVTARVTSEWSDREVFLTKDSVTLFFLPFIYFFSSSCPLPQLRLLNLGIIFQWRIISRPFYGPCKL